MREEIYLFIGKIFDL